MEKGSFERASSFEPQYLRAPIVVNKLCTKIYILIVGFLRGFF